MNVRLCAFSAVAVAALLANTGASINAGGSKERTLRVCADPNNLPFSNERREGFENRLADLVASELHAKLAYTWWAQRRGFVRNTIRNGLCDVLMGVPKEFEMTLVTKPYYRSSYVFVSRRDRGLDIRSFDDGRLKRLRVGVQLVGDDGENTPPAHALARRGVIANVVGYTLYGNYIDPNPPARIVDAVAHGDVDVAVVWGPLAGYFAGRESIALDLRPVTPQRDRNGMPLAFDIAVGVSRSQPELRLEIDRALAARRADVIRLLDRYGVPRVPADRAERVAEGPAGGPDAR
jgi:mxaJ protein